MNKDILVCILWADKAPHPVFGEKANYLIKYFK